MNFNILHDGIVIVKSLDYDFSNLFTFLKSEIIWDNSISSRKTASFGVPYNYSNINYNQVEFPEYINDLAKKIDSIVGYSQNNCLINYYFDNDSKMGYHSDQIDILDEDTGIVIISLGSIRKIRFKNKIDSSKVIDLDVDPNSFFYMTQEVQKKWLHSILPEKSNNLSERISITFRKIKTD